MNGKNVLKSRFTLIELLVVIGIIGILMAILLPAVFKAKYQAQKLEASNLARQLELAVTKYTLEYGTLPKADDGLDVYDVEIDAALLDILYGNNPRSIMFYPKGSPAINHWGGKYFISMDGDGDYSIMADGNTLGGRVAVYTKYKNDIMSSWER